MPITGQAIQFPNYPSIQAEVEDDEPAESVIELGPIATQYLRSMASKASTDKTFGLHDEGGKFYIGDSEVDIIDNDIFVDNETFDGTHGLRELITPKTPDDNMEDYENRTINP